MSERVRAREWLEQITRKDPARPDVELHIGETTVRAANCPESSKTVTKNFIGVNRIDENTVGWIFRCPGDEHHAAHAFVANPPR